MNRLFAIANTRPCIAIRGVIIELHNKSYASIARDDQNIDI